MLALDHLKQALEQDEEFRLVWADSAVALVRYAATNEERYLVNIDELEVWRSEIHRQNEENRPLRSDKFVSQEDDILWLS